jgi:hypothetical protein
VGLASSDAWRLNLWDAKNDNTRVAWNRDPGKNDIMIIRFITTNLVSFVDTPGYERLSFSCDSVGDGSGPFCLIKNFPNEEECLTAHPQSISDRSGTVSFEPCTDENMKYQKWNLWNVGHPRN